MLNQTVPQRFSLRIKGSLWEYLRLRFIIDRIESLIDDLRYSSLGISENRRIPVSNRSEDLIRLDRHVWDMGVVGYHPGFRDIYEKNKHRNFNLWKKMNDICRQNGKRFLILTHFYGDPDPMHPNQEIITFLKDNDIEFLNVGANNGDYDHWGYVNYDGHPNFLANYLKAVTLYNVLEHSNTTADFPDTLWYKNLYREINFEQEEFHKYLFGINWDKTRETYKNKTGKWLRGKAKVVLRGSEQRKSSIILIEGMSPTANNSITAFGRGSNICSKAVIAKEGLFEITLDLGQTDPASLLLIDLDAGSPVFVFRIKSLDL